MNVRYQAPETADFAILAGIHARAFAGQGAAWSASDLRSLAAMAGGTLIVAANDAETMGFCLLCGVDGHYDMLTLAVDLPFRRRGIGSGLVTHTIALLRQDNAAQITLEVAARNVPALSLYTARGFRHLATRRGYFRHNGMVDDALVMQLLIK